MWQANLAPGGASPDGFGGVMGVSTAGLYPSITTTFSDRDAVTGTRVWSYFTAAQTGRRAIRQDGTVFFIETTAPDPNNYNSFTSSLVSLDGHVGSALLRVPLPNGTTKIIDQNGVLIHDSTYGPTLTSVVKSFETATPVAFPPHSTSRPLKKTPPSRTIESPPTGSGAQARTTWAR